MRRVSIFCDIPFYYMAFSYILKKNTPVTSTENVNGKSDFTTIDCIVFILSEDNLFECIDLYFERVFSRGSINVITSGSKKLVDIFNSIAGREFSSIDIYVSINELTVYLKRAISYCQITGNNLPVNSIIKSEYETIRMISMGLSVTEIAAIKEKSVKTISSYKCNFFRKLGLKNSTANLLKLTHANGFYLHY